MLFDTHCHLNFISFKEDGDKIIADFLKNNYALLIVGSQESTSWRAIEYAKKFKRGVYVAVGLHPIDLMEESEETVSIDGQPYTFKNRYEEFDYQKYKKMALSSDKVKAIGEVGLDYYYFDKFEIEKIPGFKVKQEEALRGFIKLAEEIDLPIVFHCRGEKHDPYGAYDKLLEIVKSEINSGKKIRGVIHCFGGNLKQAREFIELGFYIGFTGIVTFKKGVEELKKIVQEITLERILAETDAPFLSPEPYRGKRCLPQYVEFVIKEIANIKTLDYDKVSQVILQNSQDLFRV
jgi:TatD DNase family protein